LSLFFGYLGIGRFYLGYTRLGIIQLAISVVSFFVIGLSKSNEVQSAAVLFWFVVFAWSLIDAVLIFVGIVKKDGQGLRLL